MSGREGTRLPGRGSQPDHERDLLLGQGDVDVLQDELARLFSTEERALAFLRNVRYPTSLIPTFTDGFQYWGAIFNDLANGVMPTPYRRLILAALRVYGSNEVLLRLLQGHEAAAVPDPRAGLPEEPGEQPEQPTCHLVLRINSEDERASIESWLSEQGFAPQQSWSTQSAVSYRLNQRDQNVVRGRLVTRPDIGWTLVPPGQPDYLLRQLFVEGPDGRRFRFSDVPVQSTVGSVATEMVEQYPEGLPGSDRPTVVDHVGADGTGRRTNPDNTLHEEGIGEGSRLRVGFQRTAAAVNPLDRRDALFGARNQLQEYVDAHPGFKVWSNSPALPTEYDIEFEQPSFGPPVSPGAQPTEISAHELSIVLGPEFPVTAPRVRWLSEIYHPNVFPTYDCEELRERDYLRGLVCLGALAESYQPSLHFGELCAMLRDIAAYRNYSVFVPAQDEVDPLTGQPVLRGDYYDRDAASWAISAEGQARIISMGGTPVLRLSRKRARFGYEIEIDA